MAWNEMKILSFSSMTMMMVMMLTMMMLMTMMTMTMMGKRSNSWLDIRWRWQQSGLNRVTIHCNDDDADDADDDANDADRDDGDDAEEEEEDVDDCGEKYILAGLPLLVLLQIMMTKFT